MTYLIQTEPIAEVPEGLAKRDCPLLDRRAAACGLGRPGHRRPPPRGPAHTCTLGGRRSIGPAGQVELEPVHKIYT